MGLTVWLSHAEILWEAKIDESDFSRATFDHNILSLQVSKDDPLVVQVLEHKQCFGSEVLDLTQLDADLLFLKLVESHTFNRFHQEVDMLVTL